MSSKTHADIVERMGAIVDRIEELSHPDCLTGAQEREFVALRTEYEDLNIERKKVERKMDRAKIRAIANGTHPGGRTVPGAPTEETNMPNTTSRDQARRRLDELARDTRLGVPADGIERMTRAFERAESQTDRPDELDMLTRWTLTTSDPNYVRAMGKIFRDPENGHREFDAAELAAFQAGKQLQRAMGEGTGGAGGYLVPFHLDPTIIITNAGAIDPIRQVARVDVIPTNVWHGVSSAGVTASWDAENTEVSDDSPTLAQPTVPTFKGAAFVAASIEMDMDTTIGQQVGVLFADAKANLEATAFLTGNGTTAPQGVITGLAAGQKIAAATADTLVAADVIKPISALPARWQPGATQMANIPTTLAMQAFETSGGALRYPELKENPARLLTTPYFVHSAMTSAGGTATAGNDNVLLAGDFGRGYLIADRIGTVVEFIPHIFGANGRPIGQRGWYCYWRTGGGVLVQDAFRLLTA